MTYNPTWTSGGGGSVSDGNKGDITVSGGGTVWSVNNSAITTAKLATSGVTAATYGGNNSIPSLTVDATGRIIAATTVVPSGTWAISISGSAASATTATTAGNVTGIVALANGGTGASTAPTARANLGLEIGANVQAWDADLDAIAALTGTGYLQRTGTHSWALVAAPVAVVDWGDITNKPTTFPPSPHTHALADLLDFGASGGYVRSNGSAWVRAAGVPFTDLTGAIADVQVPQSAVTQHQAALSVGWAQLTGVPVSFPPSPHTHALADLLDFGAAGGYVRSTGSAWARVSGVAAADLTGTVAITAGGTGATSPTDARTALGLAIGTDVQAWDADLDAIAALTGTGYLQRTGTHSWALVSSPGGSVAWADVTGTPTTLGGYGITDAQPLDGDLTAIAALAGTSGLLRKTAADTWSLDTATYLTGNQSITLSGDASGSGATAITVTISNSAVTGQALTGYSVGANTALSATDTILQAFQKAQGQINNRQPLDADLTAIAALAGTSGLLRKTAADTWSLDTATYLTANQTITLSGGATGSGSTAITVTLSNSAVTGQALTGYTSGANTALAATDTILQAFGKVQGQLDAKLTGNQTITLSGDVTGSGATAISTSIAAATVTGKALTGYSTGTNTAIAASDTILAAFGKAQGQITARATTGAVGSSGLTMNSARLLGRTTASAGAVEEITIGANLTLSSGVLSGTGGGSGPYTELIKTGDTSRSSVTTTVSADPDLQFSVVNGTTYLVEVMVFFSTTGAADFKYRFTGPTTSYARTFRRWVVGGGSAFAGITTQTALNTSDQAIAGTGAEGVVFIESVFTASADGTCAFEWSANATDGTNPAIVRRGSKMTYRTV